MASFDEHTYQAKKNLTFLSLVNSHSPTFIDWQTTIAFYTALHLINAHIAKTSGQRYITHAQVDGVINPFVRPPQASRIPQEVYTAYTSLKNLSRRSRYLVSHIPANNENRAFVLKDKHFAKAIRLLDVIMVYMFNKYQVEFQKLYLDCSLNKKHTCSFFSFDEAPRSIS